MSGALDLSFSVGLTLNTKGAVQEVLWESPVYEAGLTAGDIILAVAWESFSADRLKGAVGSSEKGFDLAVKHNKRVETVTISYSSGHHYPHLVPGPGLKRLDQILSPLTTEDARATA